MPYIYGGCGKTENLFPTELECSKTCDKDFNGGTPEVVTTPKPDSTSMKIELCLLSGNYGRRPTAQGGLHVI